MYSPWESRVNRQTIDSVNSTLSAVASGIAFATEPASPTCPYLVGKYGTRNSKIQNNVSVAAGDLIVVALSVGNSLDTMISCADAFGNTYTKVGSGNFSNLAGQSAYVFYAVANTSGITNITVTSDSTNGPTLFVHVVRGCISTNPLDAFSWNVSEAVATKSHATNSITTTTANSYLFALFFHDYTATSFLDAGTGFTREQKVSSDGVSVYCATFDKVVSAIGTYNCAASSRASSVVGNIIVAFKGIDSIESVVGTISQTITINTAISGSISAAGSLSQTLSGPGTAISGSTVVSGSINQSASLTTSFSGSVSISGPMSQVLMSPATAFGGSLIAHGSIAQTLNPIITSITSDSAQVISGSINQAITISTSMIGYISASGSIAQTVVAPSNSISASVSTSGNVNQVVRPTTAINGAVSITGTITQAISKPSTLIAGNLAVSGSINQALPKPNTAILGVLGIAGTISQDIHVQTYLDGYTFIYGSIEQTLELITSITGYIGKIVYIGPAIYLKSSIEAIHLLKNDNAISICCNEHSVIVEKKSNIIILNKNNTLRIQV
jgi:hypothetical protein